MLAGRQTFEVKELRGGEELSELPWTFVARRGDAETLEFVGEGSVRTRFPEAYVAVPEQSEVVPGEHALLQHAGTMPQLGRTVLPP